MTEYKDLQENEKNLFNKIEDMTLNMNRVSFVRVLGLLISKYRIKKTQSKTKDLNSYTLL